MAIRAILLLALLLVSLANTTIAKRDKRSEQDATASQRAESIIEEFWEWRLKDSPEYGSKFGDHRYDDRISDWTEETFLRQLEDSIKLVATVRSIPDEGLDDQQIISLRVLEANLQTFIDGFPYRKYSMYNMLNPVLTLTGYWSTLMGRNLYITEEDFQKAIARLGRLPTWVDQRIDLMNIAIAEGLTSHSASLTGLDEKIGDEIVSNPEQSPMYKKMFGGSRPSAISEAKWTELKSTVTNLISTQIVPAWEKFRNYLSGTYAQNTRTQEGVSSLPGGLEYYRACLKWHLTVDLTPQEVHQMGLDEVERVSKLMENYMKKENFDGTLQEYIALLKNQTENFFTTEDAMFEGYKEIVADAHGKKKKVPTATLR